MSQEKTLTVSDLCQSAHKCLQFSQNNKEPFEKLPDADLSNPSSKNSKINKGKWTKNEYLGWLCFIVRYSLDNPYEDLKFELAQSNFSSCIYEAMARAVKSRNSRQCECFTKMMLAECLNRKVKDLLGWAVGKLSSQTDEQIVKLVAEYRRNHQKTSEYMKIVQESLKVDQKDEEIK